MKICVAGKNNIASDVLVYVVNKFGAESILVVANSDDVGKHTWQKSLIMTAKLLGVSVRCLQDIYAMEDLIFLSIEFDKIIDPSKFVTKKLFNIHFSLLPKYKGVFTSIWPILNGESISGVTLHKIDRGIDTGHIIDFIDFSIKGFCARDLYYKCLKIGANLVIDNIDNIVNESYNETPQAAVDSTYYSKKSIDFNNIINLNSTAFQIYNSIKAISFFEYQLPSILGFNIYDAEITSNVSNCKPGQIIFFNNIYMDISTIDYDIRLYKDYMLDAFKAIMQGEYDAVKESISLTSTSRLNLTNKNGWSLLMIAAYNNYADLVSELIDAGASVNQVNQNETSVLMYAKDGAVASGSMESMTLLIKAGANVLHKDIHGKTVRDYSIEQGAHVVINLLDSTFI